jgi:hypothetical protein
MASVLGMLEEGRQRPGCGWKGCGRKSRLAGVLEAAEIELDRRVIAREELVEALAASAAETTAVTEAKAETVAEVRTWATDNDIELIFLPTYGSWLNWIEAEFAALRYFALNGTDHRSHDEQNAAIGAYVR